MEPHEPAGERQGGEVTASWRDPRKPLWGKRVVAEPEKPERPVRVRANDSSTITGIDVPFGDVFWIVAKVMIAQFLIGVILLILGVLFWLVVGVALWDAVK